MKYRIVFILIAASLLIGTMIPSENREDNQLESYKSNILDNCEKRKEAEEFILADMRDALQNTYSSGAMSYYDPDSLCARVDDELTNQYIARQLIYDIDPAKDPEEAKELYLNHYYSVLLEYVAEYDPKQSTVIDREEGRARVKDEFLIIERNGKWEIYSHQYRGSTPVFDGNDSGIRACELY